MFDIKFFRNVAGLKEKIVSRKMNKSDADTILREFDALRDRKPFVFNIETTNYCNMRCVMCPRTTLMTRKNIWIDDEMFERVLDQMRPHSAEDLRIFWDFVYGKYNLDAETRSENGFYFHISSRCVTLHGYGEPLLDKNIIRRVEACTKRNIPTYFSCVPANIDLEKVEALMRSGLTVLKFSIDALDDEKQRQIRGRRANFHIAYEKILKVLDLKRAGGYKTTIVPTMIVMGTDESARAMHREFLDLWKDKDVFAYVKSLDNRWLYQADSALQNRSHYADQYCEFPWTSLTVMADGSVVPCTQDYDAEMCMGNVNEQSLEEIWNSEKYAEFRRWHVTGEFPKGFKCAGRCDLKKLHSYLDRT